MIEVCFYGAGYVDGDADLEWYPPTDEGDAWDYLNGYLDATRKRRLWVEGIECVQRRLNARLQNKQRYLNRLASEKNQTSVKRENRKH